MRRLAHGAAGLAALGMAWLALRPVRDAEGPVFAVRRTRFVREVGAEGVLAAARSTLLSAPMESGRSQLIAWLAADGQRVEPGARVALFDASEAQRQLADGRADAGAAQARLQAARAEGRRDFESLTLERALAEREARAADSLAPDDPSIFSGHERLQARFERELIEGRRRAAQRKLELNPRQRAAAEALARVEGSKAAIAVAAASRGLRGLELRAPHAGLLMLVRNWRGEIPQVGQTVWPGQRLAEIPDLSVLQARVHVLEADAAGLEAGRMARVFVDGADSAELGARVARVEPAPRPREPRSPVRYFEAWLALEGDGRGFALGRRVRARLLLEQQDGVLAVPRAALVERDGRQVMYLAGAGRPRPVEVKLGATSASHVVVLAGLAEGQRVLLSDPARAPLAGVATPRPAAPAPAAAARVPGLAP